MITIRIAHNIIGIENRFDYIVKLCKKYITNEKAEIVLYVTDADLNYEREEMSKVDSSRYSDAWLEALSVHRKVCNYLINFNTLAFHASALTIDGKALLFTAPSGTGKSTHARLWRERFGNRVVVVNDDKPFVSFEPDGSWLVWGSPWSGKEQLHNNIAAPIRAIVLLHQAPVNSICKASDTDMFAFMLNQSYICSDYAYRSKNINLIMNLCQLPLFRLGCTISQEAVDLVYNTIILNQ